MKLSPSGRCAKCGRWAEKLELDHKKPLHKGGKHTTSNLQWLDHTCHARKTKRDTAYLKRTPEFREKIRAAVTASWKNPVVRAHHAASAKGHFRSPLQKKRLSRIVKLKMATPEVRAKLLLAWVGRKKKFGPSGNSTWGWAQGRKAS